MSIVNEFGKAVASIVKFGGKLNKEEREEVRKIIGELSDELDRALMLALQYLEGVKNIKDKTQLSEYLRSGFQNIMQSFSEYKICAGLYDLHDRFNRVFDPVKYSVSIGNLSKVQELIGSLHQGERIVADELNELLTTLRDIANELDSVSKEDEHNIKKELKVILNLAYLRLEERRKLIKVCARQLFDHL